MVAGNHLDMALDGGIMDDARPSAAVGAHRGVGGVAAVAGCRGCLDNRDQGQHEQHRRKRRYHHHHPEVVASYGLAYCLTYHLSPPVLRWLNHATNTTMASSGRRHIVRIA